MQLFILKKEIELIDDQTKARLVNAIRCSPFNSVFYKDIRAKGLNAHMVFQNSQEYCITSSKWFRNPNSVESTFEWFIKIGILRREVDGQGLTERIRLTPIARKILEDLPNLPIEAASFKGKIIYWLERKFTW